MSLTQNLNVIPFSLTGLNNINASTINGNTIFSGNVLITFSSASLPTLTYDATTATIILNLPYSSATNNGILKNTDWILFNSKENSLTFTSPLTRVSDTISIPQATTSVSGYLSSTDWTTFNNKLSSIVAGTNINISGGNTVNLNTTVNNITLAGNNNITANTVSDSLKIALPSWPFTSGTSLYLLVQETFNKCYYISTSDFYSKYPPLGVALYNAIDINNANYNFDTSAKISLMNNGYIFSSTTITSNLSLILPSATLFTSVYGSNYTIQFSIIGNTSLYSYNLNYNAGGTTNIFFDNKLISSFPYVVACPNNYYVNVNINNGIVNYFFFREGVGAGPTLQSVLDTGNTSTGKNLDIGTGILISSVLSTDTILSNVNTAVNVSSEMQFASSIPLTFLGEVNIKRLTSSILTTSGTTTNLNGTTINVAGTNLFLNSLPNWSTINNQDNLYRLCQTTNGKTYFLDRLNFNKQLHYNIDINNADYTFGTIPTTTANIIENCIIYSSTAMTANRTISLPLYDTFGYAYSTSNYQFQFNINYPNSSTFVFLINLAGSDTKTTVYLNGTSQTLPLTLSNRAYTVNVSLSLVSGVGRMVYNIMDNFGLIPQANVWTNTNQFKNDFSVVNGTNTTLNLTNTLCDLKPRSGTPINIATNNNNLNLSATDGGPNFIGLTLTNNGTINLYGNNNAPYSGTPAIVGYNAGGSSTQPIFFQTGYIVPSNAITTSTTYTFITSDLYQNYVFTANASFTVILPSTVSIPTGAWISICKAGTSGSLTIQNASLTTIYTLSFSSGNSAGTGVRFTLFNNGNWYRSD